MSAFTIIAPEIGYTCSFYVVKEVWGAKKKKAQLSSERKSKESGGTDDFPTPESPARRI
jgi:hypothetical protein